MSRPDGTCSSARGLEPASGAGLTVHQVTMDSLASDNCHPSRSRGQTCSFHSWGSAGITVPTYVACMWLYICGCMCSRLQSGLASGLDRPLVMAAQIRQ